LLKAVVVEALLSAHQVNTVLKEHIQVTAVAMVEKW
jgi:hypothetical protein